ncbi:MAG: HEAT repeat domain-containing protein, partial [Planctomycetota bacterium]|nr:HEAT repeat domain-containing protein [Planctomycetota bacterium]
MKKKVLISLFPCLLIVAAFTVLIPREPMYQWWTLKRWVDVKTRSRGPVHRSILNLNKVDDEGVQFFISGLSHEDKYIREGSSELLIFCGSNALPALKTCLSSEDPLRRRGALTVFEKMDLVRLGRAYSALAKAHDSADVGFRKRVGDLLLDYSIRAELPKAEFILVEYRKTLSSKYPETRFWAAYILALNGEQHEGMPTILMKNLEHPNGPMRLRAVSALAVMKYDSKVLARAFMKSLKDPDIQVRMKAMEGLIYLGAPAGEAAGPFLDLLEDKNKRVSGLALRGLKVFRSKDKALLPPLVGLLNSTKPETRSFACKELLRFGVEARTAIPGIVKVLESVSEKSRQGSLIKLLGRIGSDSEEAALAIIPFLASKTQQALATTTLRGMELRGARVRERLVTMMKDEERLTRMRGGRLLGLMGAGAEPALPTLVEAVYTKRIYCGNVTESFILIGKHIDSVALHAAGYLRLKHEWVQASWTKRILKSMGERAKPALPILEEILKTHGLKRRREIVELVDIFGESSVPLLRLALQDKNEGLRLAALKVLQRLGIQGKGAVGDLIVLLKDSEDSLRREFAKTLGIICDDVDETFLELLKGPNNELKGLVFVILQHMKSRAAKAIPTLLDQTGNKELWVRECAFDTLWKIGPKAVPKLSLLLRSEDADTRRCALYALGNIGVLAKHAVPAIKKCLEDSDSSVRKGARFAMKKIV